MRSECCFFSSEILRADSSKAEASSFFHFFGVTMSREGSGLDAPLSKEAGGSWSGSAEGGGAFCPLMVVVLQHPIPSSRARSNNEILMIYPPGADAVLRSKKRDREVVASCDM